MENTDDRGPIMIAATSILKPPPLRIGRIGSDEHGWTLPRTVSVKSALAGAGGALVGLLVAVPFLSVFTAVLLPGMFGLVGVALSNYSPSKGETLTQYLRVVGNRRLRQKATITGERVGVSVGIARLKRVAACDVQLVRGAVDVREDNYDERGVLRSKSNRNETPTVRPERAPEPDEEQQQRAEQPGAAERRKSKVPTSRVLDRDTVMREAVIAAPEGAVKRLPSLAQLTGGDDGAETPEQPAHDDRQQPGDNEGTQ